jgi:hypothetical protein|tara:strand:+ start:56 stop:610 length:555 start_codon:yes stop_codon:yes gene_type:complete
MRYRIYWIHNDRETDPPTEGYIGVTTKTLKLRLTQHGWKTKETTYTTFFPQPDDRIELLETYTSQKKAYAREAELRPERNIGRNIAAGGIGGSFQNKSDEHKQKIGAKKKAWWDSPEGQAHKKKRSEQMKGNTWREGKTPHTRHACEIHGVKYNSIREASKALGLNNSTVCYRLGNATYGYKLL